MRRGPLSGIDFRNRLVIQAQEDQVKAHRISLSIQKYYKGLGEPYTEDRDRAIAILGKISDNARAILNDRKNRRPILENPEPFSWKTFFIGPLWVEFQNRQDWWQTTQKLELRLSRNPSGFSAVEKLVERLADKGKITKAEFASLKNKSTKLAEAFQAEARTPTQFQDQIQELAQLDQKIDQTIEIYLKGSEYSPKQVSTAASTLGFYQRALGQLTQTLITSKDIRHNTRSQLEKNQALIDIIDGLLITEEETNHPVQTFRETLNAEIKTKQEQEQKRATGIYLQQPAQEQYERLRMLEKNLRVLTQERFKLKERLTRGEREITLTEAWIKSIEPPFIIDQTDIILEEVQKQQSMLYQLVQSSEDLALMSSQVFIDPQKLASNRTIFDQQVKTYQSLYQELHHQIPPAIERLRAAIQNLRPLSAHYHNGLNLASLTTETQSLEDSWNTTKDLPQIKESQIGPLTDNLHKYEKSLQDINQACQKAETQYQANASDRTDLQRIIEDQTFVEYHQVMQVISREYQSTLSDQAGDYARQAEGLNTDIEQIDTDFAAATRDAARLLANMKTLWGSYKQQYANEKKEYQVLAEKLTAYLSIFVRYQEHNLSAIRARVSEPVTDDFRLASS